MERPQHLAPSPLFDLHWYVEPSEHVHVLHLAASASATRPAAATGANESESPPFVRRSTTHAGVLFSPQMADMERVQHAAPSPLLDLHSYVEPSKHVHVCHAVGSPL